MRGFVNSWAVAIVALSVVILFTVMYSLQTSFSDVDAGYSTELVRWAGDLDNVSSVAGDCQKGVLSSQLEGASKVSIIDNYNTGRNRTVVYHSSLLDLNVTLGKDYPPYLDFKFPSAQDNTIDCINHLYVWFSWYKCDPDGDNVTTTLFVDSSSLGSTQGTTLKVSCDDLPAGQHLFKIVGTDGQLTYTDTIEATVEKS